MAKVTKQNRKDAKMKIEESKPLKVMQEGLTT